MPLRRFAPLAPTAPAGPGALVGDGARLRLSPQRRPFAVFASLTCSAERPRRALLSKRARRPFGRRYACPLWRSPLRGSVVGSYEPQTERDTDPKTNPSPQTRPGPRRRRFARLRARRRPHVRPPVAVRSQRTRRASGRLRRPAVTSPAGRRGQEPPTPTASADKVAPCFPKPVGSGASGKQCACSERRGPRPRFTPTPGPVARVTRPRTRPTPPTLPRMMTTAKTAPATPCAVGRWRFAPTRPGEGVHDAGDGRHGPPQCDPRRRRQRYLPPRPPLCQKGQPTVFHFPRCATLSGNPSLSLVDTRRAWSPQCDPCRRPGRRSPGPGPASSLSAGGATLFRRPGRRSLQCDPHGDGRRDGYAARVRPSNVWKIGRGIFQSLETRHPAARARKTTAQDAPRLAIPRRRGSSILPFATLPAMPMHGACTRLAESPPDPGGGFADSPRRRPQSDPRATPRPPPQSRPRPGFIAERRAALRSSAGPVAGPASQSSRRRTPRRLRRARSGRWRFAPTRPGNARTRGKGARASGGKGASEHRTADEGRRRQTETDARGRGGQRRSTAAHRPARLFR